MDYIDREVNYFDSYILGILFTVCIGGILGSAFGWIGILSVLLGAMIIAFCFEKYLQKKVRSELWEVRGDLVASTQRVLELQQRLLHRPDPNIELLITEQQLRANNLELKDRYERELTEAREANHAFRNNCPCYTCVQVRNEFAIEHKKLELAEARIEELTERLAKKR